MSSHVEPCQGGLHGQITDFPKIPNLSIFVVEMTRLADQTVGQKHWQSTDLLEHIGSDTRFVIRVQEFAKFWLFKDGGPPDMA